jgi:hypothetical protein
VVVYQRSGSPSATNGERQLTRPLDEVLERNAKRGRGSDGEDKDPTTMAASQRDIGTSAEKDYACPVPEGSLVLF